ncbi:hypothetical protein Tsubulata_018718 [Turnera subulata]|uniref:Uncharacterized protein n=1 Tax=Turnera subulata TaxID=218843 RepID=A0A9Q0GF90_9ROSI|nr:hypothetical protein Tsubulata_018718 [Turnera subulata]
METPSITCEHQNVTRSYQRLNGSSTKKLKTVRLGGGSSTTPPWKPKAIPNLRCKMVSLSPIKISRKVIHHMIIFLKTNLRRLNGNGLFTKKKAVMAQQISVVGLGEELDTRLVSEIDNNSFEAISQKKRFNFSALLGAIVFLAAIMHELRPVDVAADFP